MAQSHSLKSLTDSSDSYIKAYILQSERNMVEPEPAPNGMTEAPGIIQSIQTMNLSKSSGDILLENNKNNPLNYFSQPTQEQINKGSYYDDLAKEKDRLQDEIYSDIKKANDETPAKPKKTNTPSKFLRLADTSAEVKAATVFYDSAYAEIYKMLSGEDSLDLKRAVFVVENAYHGNTLDYEQYLKKIDNLVTLCKSFLKKNGYDITNKLACNYTIQSLYSDTLKYEKKTFYPFIYDLEDFLGDKDYTKQFVTKLLNTGTGQCHSMPLLYLILAQELHTDAYLVLAPSHSFIKYPVGNTLYGFETTCGRQTNDKFMTASGYLSSEAIHNKIYLAPQTLKQTIAQCLVDLSTQYALTYGYNNFVVICCDAALQFNPECIGAMQNKANAGTAWCAHLAAMHNNPPLQEYSKYPELKTGFDNMVNLQLAITNMGYVRIPKEQYAQWLASAQSEEQKRMQLLLKNKLHSYLENKTQ